MKLKIEIQQANKGEYLFSPFATILVESSSIDIDGNRCISPQCNTERELEFYVKRIKQELDTELSKIIKRQVLPK